MAIGDVLKNRITIVGDEEFGYRIIKPVEDDMTRTMYFTSNPFCNDNEHLVISAIRDNVENFYLLNFINGVMVKLTEENNIRISQSYFDKKRNLLYYSNSHELKRVNVFSLNHEIIYYSKNDIQSIAITCDGKFLVTNWDCDYEYKNNDGQDVCLKMSQIIKVDLISGKESHILYRSFAIDHIQCSPTDPDVILFCSKGYYACNHRMWKTNLNGTKGGALGPEQPNEHRTHEYFTPTGKKIAYHGKFFTVNDDFRFKKIFDTFGIMNVDGSEDKYYKCPSDLKPGHSCISPNENIIICDSANFISSITLNNRTMEIEYDNLYRHNSTMSSNFVHPHPSFSNDGRYVVFATDRGGMDRGNIYLLDLS